MLLILSHLKHLFTCLLPKTRRSEIDVTGLPGWTHMIADMSLLADHWHSKDCAEKSVHRTLKRANLNIYFVPMSYFHSQKLNGPRHWGFENPSWICGGEWVGSWICTCLVSVVTRALVVDGVLSLSTGLFGMVFGVGYGVGCQEDRNKTKNPPLQVHPHSSQKSRERPRDSICHCGPDTLGRWIVALDGIF